MNAEDQNPQTEKSIGQTVDQALSKINGVVQKGIDNQTVSKINDAVQEGVEALKKSASGLFTAAAERQEEPLKPQATTPPSMPKRPHMGFPNEFVPHVAPNPGWPAPNFNPFGNQTHEQKSMDPTSDEYNELQHRHFQNIIQQAGDHQVFGANSVHVVPGSHQPYPYRDPRDPWQYGYPSQAPYPQQMQGFATPPEYGATESEWFSMNKLKMSQRQLKPYQSTVKWNDTTNQGPTLSNEGPFLVISLETEFLRCQWEQALITWLKVAPTHLQEELASIVCGDVFPIVKNNGVFLLNVLTEFEKGKFIAFVPRTHEERVRYPVAMNFSAVLTSPNPAVLLKATAISNMKSVELRGFAEIVRPRVQITLLDNVFRPFSIELSLEALEYFKTNIRIS